MKLPGGYSYFVVSEKKQVRMLSIAEGLRRLRDNWGRMELARIMEAKKLTVDSWCTTGQGIPRASLKLLKLHLDSMQKAG